MGETTSARGPELRDLKPTAVSNIYDTCGAYRCPRCDSRLVHAQSPGLLQRRYGCAQCGCLFSWFAAAKERKGSER